MLIELRHDNFFQQISMKMYCKQLLRFVFIFNTELRHFILNKISCKVKTRVVVYTSLPKGNSNTKLQISLHENSCFSFKILLACQILIMCKKK